MHVMQNDIFTQEFLYHDVFAFQRFFTREAALCKIDFWYFKSSIIDETKS